MKTPHFEKRSKAAVEAHQRRWKKGKTSSFRGVCWDARLKKWKASIKHQGKKIHIGMFDDDIDAAKAYDDKAKALKGLKAKVNFVDMDLVLS